MGNTRRFGAQGRRLFRASLICGVFATAACTSMRRVEPAAFIPQYNPGLISVWTAGNRVTIVSDPQIQGDTLIGTVLQSRWAVSLHDILRVEARRADATKTALFFAGAAASGVGLYLISTAGRGSGSVPCPPDFSPDYKTELCGLR